MSVVTKMKKSFAGYPGEGRFFLIEFSLGCRDSQCGRQNGLLASITGSVPISLFRP